MLTNVRRLITFLLLVLTIQRTYPAKSGYSRAAARPPCNHCGSSSSVTYTSSTYVSGPSPCSSGCYGNGGGTNLAYDKGKAVGSVVGGVIGAKISKIQGFIDGVAQGVSGHTGGGGGGCSHGGCGGGNNVVVVHQQTSSGCGSHGCGGSSSFSSGCGSHGCGESSSFSSGCGSHGCGSSSYNNAAAYPNCQCDWLFNDHGQGNCNVGARSHTSDRWCYVSTKVNGKWVEPQWTCPDSRASTVHHGRYWSNVACNTAAPSSSYHG